MNDTLLKIIERYELDKPIMMSDKLDIIWDKSEPIQELVQDEQAEEDPEVIYERLLKESRLTAEEAFKLKLVEEQKVKDQRREKLT